MSNVPCAPLIKNRNIGYMKYLLIMKDFLELRTTDLYVCVLRAAWRVVAQKKFLRSFISTVCL
jgi:hypothetical protein